MAASSTVLRRELLWYPLKKYKLHVALGFLALTVSSLVHGGILFILGPLFESILNPRASGAFELPQGIPDGISHAIEAFVTSVQIPWQVSVVIPIVLLVLAFIKGCAGYLYHYCQHFLSIQVASHYREKLFGSILLSDYQILISRPASEWMSLVMNDVNVLQSRFSELTTNLIRDCTMVLVGVITMTVIHPMSVLSLLVAVPILAFVTGRIGKKVSGYSDGWQKELAIICNRILIIRKRLEFVKAQAGESWELTKFEEANNRYYGLARSSLLVRSGFAPWLEFVGFSLFVLILIAINQGYWFTGFDSVKLLQFFAALGMMIRPLRNIGEQITKLHETKGALKQGMALFEDRHFTEGLLEAPLPPQISRQPLQSVAWKALSVGFQGADPLLSIGPQIIEEGQSIAIVGASGSGKTTLIKTLAGLLPPSSIDGLDPAHLRENVSYVSQHPFCFKGSVRENLNYGRCIEGDNSLELTRMLVFLGLEEALAPEGLELVISPMEQRLSGGQRQRLVIGRALLQKKKVLLFDEATSALDPVIEVDLTEKIIGLTKKKKLITFFVTHRVAHLGLFDRVWFVRDGRLFLDGHHEELIRDESYQKFIQSESLAN